MTGVGDESVDHPATAGLDYFGGPITIGGERAATALPTQPERDTPPAIIRVLLKRIGAVRFRDRHRPGCAAYRSSLMAGCRISSSLV